MASLRRLWRFYGAPSTCYRVPTVFKLAINRAFTECSRRVYGVLGVATAHPTPHVSEVRKKTTVSLKEKMAGAASVEVVVVDVDDDQQVPGVVRAETPPETTSRQRLEPIARRSSASSTKKASQEEERLLSDIATRGEQSIAFQTKVLEMLASPKATERTAYADWAKEVMVGLHPSLWLRFQREFSSLLYTYQEESVEFLHPVPQQQHYPAKQQHQACPSTTLAARSPAPRGSLLNSGLQPFSRANQCEGHRIPVGCNAI